MEDVISLGVGEPDFVTPWTIRESCIYGLEQGRTSYTANRGLPELREEIVRHKKEQHGLDYDANTDVLVTVGVSEALDIALRAMLAPGDEVLIPEPCYVSYKACTTLAGGVAVPVPARIENEFRITAADLEAHVTPRTRVLLIGYTNNPTGAVMRREHLMELARFARGRGLSVWCYTGYTFEDIMEWEDNRMTLLKNIDVLVDGAFEIDKMSLDIPWRGSTNQRLIDVQKSLEKGEVILYDESGEF